MSKPLIKPLFNPLFRFRDREIDLIHDYWNDGGSILLTGIRRTGKSEVLKAALYRYAQAGHAVGHLDVQDYDDLSRFYQDILKILIQHAPPSFKSALAEFLQKTVGLPDALARWIRAQVSEVSIPGVLDITLTPAGEQLVRYWQPLVEQLANALAVQDRTTLPVIGIDELPFMLENLSQARVPLQELKVMLASLRKLRDAGLRLVVAGSISFENLLSLHEIPHTVLGGFFRLSIPTFSRDEAASYLAERLDGTIAASPEAIAYVSSSACL